MLDRAERHDDRDHATTYQLAQSHVEEAADDMVDPDPLWRVLRSFQGVAEWHPMLASVHGDGEQPGAIRRAVGDDGSEQVERLQKTDPAQRRYRWASESSTMPVRDYHAELQVQAKDNGKRTVR